MKDYKYFKVVKEGTPHIVGHKLGCDDEAAIKRMLDGKYWEEIPDPSKKK